MKRLISIRAFCETYGTGRTRTYDLIAGGELQAVKNGSRTMIDIDSAERWAASLPRFKSAAASVPAAKTALPQGPHASQNNKSIAASVTAESKGEGSAQ